MKKVLIIGGGFAGIQAAIEMKKKPGFDVTLISDREFFYIYPISIWVPTHGIDYEDVKIDLAEIQKVHGFNLIIDEVIKIHSAENKIFTKYRALEYDYLIVTMGADKMKHPGIENTLSICGKPEISLEIQKRLDELILKGEGKIAVGFGGNPLDKSAVRGGPAFELIFNIHNLLKKKKIRDNFELNFFAPMEEPGARMGKKSMQMADSMLSNFGIKKYFGKKIKMFESEGVVFADDSKLQSDLTVFIPASAGNSFVKQSDLSLSEAGFINIDDTCLVQGTSNVYAAGDVAALEGPDWKAKQGHTAEIMARNAVFNIWMNENKKGSRRGYMKHLNIICVMDTGNGAAFVYRDGKSAFVIPLPFVGHYLKKGWGFYSKLTKKSKFPRIPGL